MAILGVSGSAKVGGNTDRMVEAVLERSGKESALVNLSTLHFDPCRGCCHLCAKTNVCGVKDEIHPYLKLVLEAEALVLGTPYQLGMPTGFMFNFLTRLKCFYHVEIVLVERPAVLVSVGCKDKELQVEQGMLRFEEMVTHGRQIRPLGHIYFNSQAPPCLTCGAGRECRNGGLWKYVVGEDEAKLQAFEFTPDKCHKWEDSPEIAQEVERCGKILAEL